jgi:hypothetical protein
MIAGVPVWLRFAPLVAMLAVLLAPAPAAGRLSSRNNTPFPSSGLIVGAQWTSRRYAPPANQWGDILPTVWADDGDQYTLMDDGGTDVKVSGGIWRQSLARITGTPPRIHLSHVGDPDKPPPHNRAQISRNPGLWSGPLGNYYSSGLVEAGRLLFATQQLDWSWGSNGPFSGLRGIAYSADHGRTWRAAGRRFPAPLGNLNWVIRGRGGVYPDGYVYAIATEREFNATRLIMGRTPADRDAMTDPDHWQWLAGWTGAGSARTPVFSSSLAAATPIAAWQSHISYPQMAYDAPLHRYLLTFTYSYANRTPGLWRNGAEFVLLEAPNPWGPFSFVAREPRFGPSNGYGAGFPLAWISRDGRSLWLKWAANFDGCAAKLDCSGGYGFNYRRLRLRVAGHRR